MGRIEAITRALSNLKKVGSRCKPEVDEVDVYGKPRCGSPYKSTEASKVTVYASLPGEHPLSKVWRPRSSHKGVCQQFLAPDNKTIQDGDDETDPIQVAKPCKGRSWSSTCCKVAAHVPIGASSTTSIDPTSPFSSDNASTRLNLIPSTKVAVAASDTLLHPSPRRLSSSSSSGVALKPSQPSILGESKRARCQADNTPQGAQGLVGSNSLSSGGSGGFACRENGLSQFNSAGGAMPSTSDRPSTSECAGDVGMSTPPLLRRQSSALSALGGVQSSSASTSMVLGSGCSATAGVRLPALRPASYPLSQPPPLEKLPHACRPAIACSDLASPDGPLISPSTQSATGPGAVVAATGTRVVSGMGFGSTGQVPSGSLSFSGSCQTRPTLIPVATNVDPSPPSVRQYAPQPPATPPPAYCQQHPAAAAATPARVYEEEQDRPATSMLFAAFGERPSPAMEAPPWRRASSVTSMQRAHEGPGGLLAHAPRTAPPSATAAGAAAARELRSSAYLCAEGPLMQARLLLGSPHVKGSDREGVRSLTALDGREAVADGSRGEVGSMGGSSGARAVCDGGNVWCSGSSMDEGSSSRCSACRVDEGITFDIVQGAGRWFDAGDLSYCNPESKDMMARILEDLSRTEVVRRHRLKGSSASRSLNNIGAFYPLTDVTAASAVAAVHRAVHHSCYSKAKQLTKMCMSPPSTHQDPYATTPLDPTKTSVRGDVHPNGRRKEQQHQLLPPRYPSTAGLRPNSAIGARAPAFQYGTFKSGDTSSGGCDINHRSCESLVSHPDLPVMSGGSITTTAARLLAISPAPSGPHGAATAANPLTCFGTTGVQAP